MANWTKENIPNLEGKTAVVTGGNSGLGYEAVKMLAEKGAAVILASRSVENGKSAKTEILKEIPAAKIEVMQLDLSDLSSVRNFATEFKARHSQLDMLINNAGVMGCPYAATKDGFDMQMGVNHLGHFALTGLLLDTIVATKGSRVVNVSSLAHASAKWNPDQVVFTKESYSANLGYYNSKLANLLFTYELQRKFEEVGADSIAVAAHPGGSMTNLNRYMNEVGWYRFMKPLIALMSHSPAMGALPEVRAAVAPDVKGGDYYGPKGFGEMTGYPIKVKSSKDSHNAEYAKRLWVDSEKLTKIKYQF